MISRSRHTHTRIHYITLYRFTGNASIMHTHYIHPRTILIHFIYDVYSFFFSSYVLGNLSLVDSRINQQIIISLDSALSKSAVFLSITLRFSAKKTCSMSLEVYSFFFFATIMFDCSRLCIMLRESLFDSLRRAYVIIPPLRCTM